MNSRSLVRLVCLVAGLLFVFNGAGLARTIYVSPTGIPDGTGASWGTAFQTISSAITASASGDEIWIRSATYSESISMNPGLTLYGGFPPEGSPDFEDRDWQQFKTVIDAGGTGSVVRLGGGSTTLDGLTITGGGGSNGGGLYCKSSIVTLRNSRITNNTADYGGGILIDGGSLTLENCQLDENRGNREGGALYIKDADAVVLTKCLLTNNQSFRYGSAILTYDSKVELTDCLIADNEATFGGTIGVYGGSLRLVHVTMADNSQGSSSYYGGIHVFQEVENPIQVVNSILWDNELPVNQLEGFEFSYCNLQLHVPGTGTIMAPPLFVKSVSGYYRLRDGSPCIGRGNPADAPATDLEGNPRPGSDGKVDMGAYETPYGYVAGPSIHPIHVKAGAAPGGDGSSWEEAFPSITGALAFASPGTDIWVAVGRYTDPVQMKSQVYLFGGFRGDETRWEERANRFEETILDGQGYYKSIVSGGSWSELNGFSLINGTASNGAGLSCIRNAYLQIRNCSIRDCIAQKGAGVSLSVSSPQFENCLIADNRGGAVYTYNYEPWNNIGSQFIHCTIAGNSSYEGGAILGGIYRSCILWNSGNSIISPINATIVNSIIDYNPPGTGNLNEDPLFVDPEEGDYRLQAASPAIDRGTNDILAQMPPSDLAGRVRLWDGDDVPGAIIDLGAYEYGAGPLGIEYGDIDESGAFEYYEPFLFSLYWQEENNETSYRYNPVPGEKVDASDLLFLLGEWK